MGQLATQLNQQQSQNSNRLPSQSVQNPENVSAITLRSGKQCQEPQPTNEPAEPHSTPEKDDAKNENVKSKLPNNFYAGESKEKQHISLPFPQRAISNKKMEEAEKEILEIFRKVEVNIPLLEAIKQIPRYAKFWDYC